MRKKNQLPARDRGLTLVEVVVGALLTALLVIMVISILKTVQNSAKLNAVKSNLGNQALAAGLFLKNKLEGTRSFQNLAMAVPGVGASSGTGFYVDPDPLFRNVIPGPDDLVHDTIFIIVADQLNNRGRLGPPVPGQWTISTLDGTAITPVFPGAGELIVLSRTTDSEIIHATNPPVVSGPTLNVGTFIPTFDCTFGGRITRNYVEGDYVRKATLMKVFLDPATNQLQASTVVGPGVGDPPHVIANNMTSFAISYNSFSAAGKNKLGTCPDRTLTARVFEHDWATQNVANAQRCYLQLSLMGFDMKFQDFLGVGNANAVNSLSKQTFITNN